jgi:hypothetical protein
MNAVTLSLRGDRFLESQSALAKYLWIVVGYPHDRGQFRGESHLCEVVDTRKGADEMIEAVLVRAPATETHPAFMAEACIVSGEVRATRLVILKQEGDEDDAMKALTS